jgi:hypothetical protein
MEYFPLWYRFNSEDGYLIWISDEKDSVVVEAGGFIPTFKDHSFLRQYADTNHYSLQSGEPILHDLDCVAAWTKSPAEPVNCEEALAAWNLFGDVAASVGGRGIAFQHLDSQLLAIYRKLFWGNNLPSMTPQGSQYVPEWSPDEIASLTEILITGLDLFASCTRSWPQE